MKRTISILHVFSIIALFSAAFFMTACGNNQAKSLSEGNKAYESENFEKAAMIYLPLAYAGNMQAQETIAYMYYYGVFFKRDFSKSIAWYEKSAKQGNPSAQFSLATMYENGEGTEDNQYEAYFWYSLAAKQNFPEAAEIV